MKLFSTIRNMLSSDSGIRDKKVKLLGMVDANCPYCNVKLEKQPGRKKKCPSCSNYIYVRTRPQDREKVLLREDQLIALEEQWAIVNGTHDHFLSKQTQLKSVSDKLQRRFGKEPSKNDIQWSILNDDGLTHIQNKDWGLYRNTRQSMSEILRKEGKHLKSIDLLLEVCTLDLSGAQNCGGFDDPLLLREFPPFDPSMGGLANGITAKISHAMELSDISLKQVKVRFGIVAKRLKKSLRLPLKIENAWKELENHLQ